ncbi:D-alanine--D-alanine ligase, partial [Patescibacteria group bacterium]|nr:D-alanine--D-alanine ligase [Patescibacteria group bacterium]
HEISLQSAKNVFSAIDKEKYEVVLVGINKTGKWLLFDSSNFLLHPEDTKLVALGNFSKEVVLSNNGESAHLINISQPQDIQPVDVVFPILHGTFGEDGTIQGLLKLANVPFAGASVLGSAVGMDKDVMKRLLEQAKIPISKFMVFHQGDQIDFEEVKQKLGLPLFIKPANLGSSVGISKVQNKEQFEAAVKDAFNYDSKIIIEENIAGREIECAVLGNENPIASIPGEVIPKHEFYSYEAKYLDENGASLEMPAKLPEDIIKQVQNLAVKAFKVLCCEGMGRVDLFLTEDGKLYVNEINTIPGFTKISMYPKLWEISGISYKELIDELIQLALDRFEKEQKLKTSHVFKT